MTVTRCLLILLQSLLLVNATDITPQPFTFPTLGAISVNGSSATGHCSSVTLNRNATTTCHTPTSSVLFDGIIPTLTGLEGDTWAGQFMVLQRRSPTGSEKIHINFSPDPGYTGVGRVEIVMFNCPQWGITAERIVTFNPYTNTYLALSSCTSLQKVCIPFSTTQTVLDLLFQFHNEEQRVYLAEITFHSSSSPCPAFTLLNPPPTDSEPATVTPHITPPPGFVSFFQGLGATSVNGSSATGHCSSVTLNRNATTTCHTPTSSVLFDGIIPTLTSLEGDTWASQFMVLERRFSSYGQIRMDVSTDPGHTGVGRVEIVMFNCPELGITARRIVTYNPHTTTYLTLSSCTSLQKVCIPFRTTPTVLDLRFYFGNEEQRVYLAEMTFHNSSSPCPAFTLLDPPPANIHPTTPPPTSPPASSLGVMTEANKSTANVRTPQYGVIALVLSTIAMVIVLVAILGLVLVRILCKYQFHPGGTERVGGAERVVEEQVYEEVDTGRRGPMNTLNMKENEAYSTYK